MKLGFAMDGLESGINGVFLDSWSRFEMITYVEIGVGHGGTLAGVCDIMRNLGIQHHQWRSIGIELPDGYSFRRDEVQRSAGIRHIKVRFEDDPKDPLNEPWWGGITVYLCDSHKLLPMWKWPVHVALIDGCHGKECVKEDFLNLEPFMERGGYVMFHDYGKDQIGQPQTHCPTLDVRGACEELGILDSSTSNWQFVAELIGDKKAGSANIGVFKKL